MINIDVEDGGNHTVLVREIQRHPVSRVFLHVDLVVPTPELELVATVPVNFFGKSPGVSLVAVCEHLTETLWRPAS